MTHHHTSEFELFIEFVEFFIDILSLVMFLAALPGRLGIPTVGAMFLRVAVRKTVVGSGQGQRIEIDLAEFFIDVLSLVMFLAAPPEKLGMGTVGAMRFMTVALRKTVLGRVDGQFIRIDAGIHAALANRASRSEHGDRQHSKH